MHLSHKPGPELARATTTANQLGAGNASLSGEFVIRSTMNGVVLARTAASGSRRRCRSAL